MKIAYKPFIFILLLAIAIPFVSCSDDEAAGSPSITRIRSFNPETADSSFVVALPGQNVVIEGVNLSNVQEIYFNDYPAAFNPVYNTATHIIVQIPINTPTPDRKPDVSNILRIVTKGGTAEYQFSVNPPPPICHEIYNENTRPGDTMEMSGQFLLSVNEVLFPGEIRATNIQTNSEGTRLFVEVPKEVKEAGQIKLISPYGSYTPLTLVNNTKGTGVFANFNAPGESEFGWAWWNTTRTDDKNLFPGGDGFYIRSNFTNLGADNIGWWNTPQNIGMKNESKVVVPVSDLGKLPSEYVLKFEINTRVPIRKGAVLQIMFLHDKVQYQLHPYSLSPNGVFDTGNKWKTVRVSMAEWKQTTIGDFLKPDGTVWQCNIGIVSKGVGIPEFDAAFDNIRIEPIITSK